MATLEIATLGGGCFWCLEAVYSEMDGVQKVESGYMGGFLAEPTYEAVCTGKSGHVEVVQATFDPAISSYRDILEVFFAIHDPTSLDRQGNDRGPQYRSVIFHHDRRQKETAEQTIRELEREGLWDDPVVTELRPAATFYRAEDYHQQYFASHPQQPYCSFVVAPKVRKFREHFAGKLRRRA
jgi:peptide-methionine (S)-S-oxide reductase